MKLIYSFLGKVCLASALLLAFSSTQELKAQTNYQVNIANGTYSCINIPIITTGIGGQAQDLTNTSGISTQGLTGIPTTAPSGAGLFAAPCGGTVSGYYFKIGVEHWHVEYEYCCNGTLYEISMHIYHDHGWNATLTHWMDIMINEIPGDCTGTGCP